MRYTDEDRSIIAAGLREPSVYITDPDTGMTRSSHTLFGMELSSRSPYELHIGLQNLANLLDPDGADRCGEHAGKAAE